jgi:hypothetical protein
MWSMYPDRVSRRVFSDAAIDIATSVSNYGLAAATLTGESYFEALRFASRLAGSNNAAEIAELSAAQYTTQAKAMREHANSLFELGRGTLVGATRPLRTHLVMASCVIL